MLGLFLLVCAVTCGVICQHLQTSLLPRRSLPRSCFANSLHCRQSPAIWRGRYVVWRLVSGGCQERGLVVVFFAVEVPRLSSALYGFLASPRFASHTMRNAHYNKAELCPPMCKRRELIKRKSPASAHSQRLRASASEESQGASSCDSRAQDIGQAHPFLGLHDPGVQNAIVMFIFRIAQSTPIQDVVPSFKMQARCIN